MITYFTVVFNIFQFYSHVQLEEMQMTVAGIQSDAVWWLQETALRIYRPSPADFVRALHKARSIIFIALSKNKYISWLNTCIKNHSYKLK